MASGAKSEMPEFVFVIFSGYEVRYYTTPETLAQAITDGYAMGAGAQVQCFVPIELADDSAAQKLALVVKRKPPAQPQPPHSFNLTQWPAGGLTPQQQKENEAHFRKWKRGPLKKFKQHVLDDIYAAIGRTP